MKIESVDDIMREVKSKARGRTRSEGEDPFRYWDEVLVEEIEWQRRRIETELATIKRLQDEVADLSQREPQA